MSKFEAEIFSPVSCDLIMALICCSGLVRDLALPPAEGDSPEILGADSGMMTFCRQPGLPLECGEFNHVHSVNAW